MTVEKTSEIKNIIAQTVHKEEKRSGFEVVIVKRLKFVMGGHAPLARKLFPFQDLVCFGNL